MPKEKLEKISTSSKLKPIKVLRFRENPKNKQEVIINGIEKFLLRTLEGELPSDAEPLQVEFRKKFEIAYPSSTYADNLDSILIDASVGIYDMIFKIHPPFKQIKLEVISKNTIAKAALAWLKERQGKGLAVSPKIAIRTEHAFSISKLLDEIFPNNLAEECREYSNYTQEQFVVNNLEKIKQATLKTDFTTTSVYLGIQPSKFKKYFSKYLPNLCIKRSFGFTKYTPELVGEIVNMLNQGLTIADIVRIKAEQGVKVNVNNFWQNISRLSPKHTREWYNQKKEDTERAMVEKIQEIFGEKTIKELKDLDYVYKDSILKYEKEFKEASMATSINLVANVLGKGYTNLAQSFRRFYGSWYDEVYLKRENSSEAK